MSSLPPPELLTPRLLLRLVQEADLADLLAVHADEEVNRYLPYVTWRGMADAQAWYAKVLQRRREGSAMQFVLQQQVGGRVIGGCLLFRFEPESGLAELGYALGRRDWGEGYMQEALSALLDYAFEAMQLRRIEAEVDPRNLASGQLLLGLGFQCEGLLRQRRVMKGEIKDAQMYGLLRDEWLARRAGSR